MTIIHQLEALGLSKSRAEVYLISLEIGSGSAQQIASRIGIPRTTAHEILQSLLHEGLVSCHSKGRTRLYRSEPPEKLKQRLQEKQRHLETLLPELNAMRRMTITKPIVRFYEGVNGIKTALEDTLTSKEKILRGLLSMEDLYKIPGKAFMDRYVKQRVAAGFRLHVIRSEQKDIEETWFSSRKENRELHYAPTDITFPMTMYIYDQKVTIIGTYRENFGMILESPDFYQTQKNMFEVMWQVTRVGKRID